MLKKDICIGQRTHYLNGGYKEGIEIFQLFFYLSEIFGVTKLLSKYISGKINGNGFLFKLFKNALRFKDQ